MNSILDEIESFYDECIRVHGAVATGVNWKSEEQQKVRFEYLLRLVKDDFSTSSVAEIGCGYGALYQYARDTNRSFHAYHGYDISDEMINAANDAIGDRKNVILTKGSVISSAVDYSFVSGVFNVRLKQDEKKWLNMIEKTLDNMNDMSKKGFAFNLMTDVVDWKDDNLFYASPTYFFDLCISKYSHKVQILHDMPMYEWTIHVTK